MVNVLTERPPQGKAIPARLKDQVRDLMRLKHYSLRTERTYWDWIERFIRFHAGGLAPALGEESAAQAGEDARRTWRHPREMTGVEVSAFLTHLARDGNVAASTQNQCLSALLFLYREVLKQEIGWLEGVERAHKPARLPVVLARDVSHTSRIVCVLVSTTRVLRPNETQGELLRAKARSAAGERVEVMESKVVRRLAVSSIAWLGV